MSVTQELEEKRRLASDELKEVERLLSAGQLAYYLSVIRKELENGNAAAALAEFHKDGGLKSLMQLHGHTYRQGVA